MKFTIADYNIEFDNRYNHMEMKCTNYPKKFGDIDISIEVNQNDLNDTQKLEKAELSNEELEFVSVYRKLAMCLPLKNAFVLHSATFDVDGVGVAFAAHSGTGKTTHMNLWQEYLGERMVIVNGDKPIVRFFDDEPDCPYAYGTPWNGKENLGRNMRTPLKHICFIERSDTNYVEQMKKEDVIDRIFNQVYMPKDPMAVMNTMQLIDRLLSCCKLWTIHCNMDPEAAEVAYKTIFGV